MRIEQQENGNIIIQNNRGLVTHILSSMSIQKHPRKENALVIYSIDFKGNKGIEFLANQPIYINKKRYRTNANSLLRAFANDIVMRGSKALADTKPKRKEEDSNYVAFLQANTYEKLLAFVKKHRDNIGGKNYQNGKLVAEEFYCQFDTFTIRVNLRYYFKRDKPHLINHILMWGSTQYVTKPKKVFVYDANNTVTGYVYKEVHED